MLKEFVTVSCAHNAISAATEEEEEGEIIIIIKKNGTILLAKFMAEGGYVFVSW